MSTRSHKTKTFFMPLPMFCKSSINDAINPPKSINPSTDPASPKLTCIGQIKKKPITTTTSKPNTQSNRYTKLQKLFSSKNIISPVIDTGSVYISTSKFNNKCVTTRSKSYNGRGRIGNGSFPISEKKCYMSKDDQDVVRVVVDDQELDPPLPVVKCGREPNVNLWKRRGFEMKSLQIQPVLLSVNRIGGNNSDGGFVITTSATTF